MASSMMDSSMIPSVPLAYTTFLFPQGPVAEPLLHLNTGDIAALLSNHLMNGGGILDTREQHCMGTGTRTDCWFTAPQWQTPVTPTLPWLHGDNERLSNKWQIEPFSAKHCQCLLARKTEFVATEVAWHGSVVDSSGGPPCLVSIQLHYS